MKIKQDGMLLSMPSYIRLKIEGFKKDVSGRDKLITVYKTSLRLSLLKKDGENFCDTPVLSY